MLKSNFKNSTFVNCPCCVNYYGPQFYKYRLQTFISNKYYDILIALMLYWVKKMIKKILESLLGDQLVFVWSQKNNYHKF